MGVLLLQRNHSISLQIDPDLSCLQLNQIQQIEHRPYS